MPVLSIPELQIILRSHVARFGRVVWPVWERYSELPDSHRLVYDATTQANILHDYMVENAKREFDGVPGVQFLAACGFYLGVDGNAYGVNGLAVCRFKKLDEDGRSKNYPTDRAEALRRNEPLDGLPDFATWVDVGYVLSDLRTAISEVQLVRVFDCQMIFSIPQSGEEGAEQFPLLPPAPTQPRFTIIDGRRSRKTSSSGSDEA